MSHQLMWAGSQFIRFGLDCEPGWTVDKAQLVKS